MRPTLSALTLSLLSTAAQAQTPAPQAPPPVPMPAPTSEPPASDPAKPAEQGQVPGARSNRVERVDVTGRNDASDARRNASAAKIVITREDLLQFGDSNLGEAMRRLPGVTAGGGRPGRPGPPQMRGLGGGFTQILIDGQRIPPGFSVQDITPDQVERIEILRAPTAETGARAIAGTINIILREPLRKTDHDVKVGVNEERGRFSPNGSWSHNGLLSETGTYSITGSVNRTDQITTDSSVIRYFDGQTDRLITEQRARSDANALRHNYFFSPRAQWRLGQGEQFNIQAFLAHNVNETETPATLLQDSFGNTPAVRQPYAQRLTQFDGRFDVARVNANLNKRINETHRYELRVGGGRFWSDTTSGTRQSFDQFLTSSTQTQRNDVRDWSWNTAGKLISNFASRGHTITSGFEYEGTDRNELGVLNQNSLTVSSAATDLDIGTRRLAIFVQDDWDITPAFAANLGLRYEEIKTTVRDGTNDIDNTSRVLTPLGHLVWRFASPSRDQVRLSLTQSYRPPNTGQLSLRPNINASYPVSQANIFSAADSIGNPNLKPERANGIDLAFERYLKSGGVISVNFFVRDIKDLIRSVTTLETVPWSPVPRYVSRVQNFGKARATGIEFDAKFQLRELIDSTTPLSFRINGNIYDSKVDGVPGPYNTLEGQARATANFGLDYRIPRANLTLGGNLAWTPSYTYRRTANEIAKTDTKRVFDAYALYRINSLSSLRFSASNLGAIDTVTESTTFSEGLRRVALTNGRTDTSFALRFETRF